MVSLQFERDTKFLVTGGAGFIGSAICSHLIDNGYYVRCLDNFSTGKQENIEHLKDLDNFELVYADIQDFKACAEGCEGIHYVLHQAAWGSVPKSIELPVDYHNNNITGTLNMMEAAKNANVKKMVIASSSSVYGDSTALPKRENETGNVLSPYALTKKTCEEYAGLYKILYNFNICSLRYFNVFGPRQDEQSEYAAVIPKFITALLSGEQPTIYGDGGQSRDFTYVKNVVNANLLACLAPDTACGRAYNIGCEDNITLNELYKTIADILKSDIKPVYKPMRPGDVRSSQADISLAKEMLSYEPEVEFKEGIRNTIEWYIKHV